MRRRSRRLRVPVAVFAALALVTLSSGTASADEGDPVGNLLGQVQHQVGKVQDQVGQVTKQVTPKQASTPAPSPVGDRTTGSKPAASPHPSSDDDLPGNETANPKEPDHGSAKLLNGTVAGQDLADVGGNDATVHNDDSTTADSTLLALGGQEVLGAHANSKSQKESHAGDPLAPVCDSSSGAVCLKVLYADAFATDNGARSHSRSQSGIGDTCLGGTSTDPDAACDGPVGLGVATSKGQANRDQSSGRTTASSEADVADLCLQPDPATGGCTLGADALHSQGKADSDGTASRDSYLLGVEAQGKSVGRVDDPTAIALQPDCVSPSVLCAYLNQGETYMGGGLVGHAQDALKATVLPATPAEIFAGAAHTETLVHNDGGNASNNGGSPGNGNDSDSGHGNSGAGGPGHPAASRGLGLPDAVSSVLPNTGGVWSGLLAIGLFSIAAGAFTMAFSRRGRSQLA